MYMCIIYIYLFEIVIILFSFPFELKKNLVKYNLKLILKCLVSIFFSSKNDMIDCMLSYSTIFSLVDNFFIYKISTKTTTTKIGGKKLKLKLLYLFYIN